uniref:NADH-ubiquinone oxidoreductase chain 5 n=1 Tax=Creontiades dilutus TaxID=173679 RepID=A0A342KBM4_9HEMI|nr:NADH dehydrogenase subunit 5 [Creontiades dilutus]AND82405.1 NADH dehydrogenase subunit 5 [Creontiades dilutus]
MFFMYIYVFIFMLIFGLIFLITSLYFMLYEYMIYMDWEIIDFNSINICMSLIFDYMSLMFMGCVLLISSMVVLYSHSYMSDDEYKYRFLFLVFMFVISMMFMIISPNMVSILLGWDGLGLVSYGLVIYFQNYNSYNAGMLTILTNRVGDVAILMCIAWMLNYGSWNYIYYMSFFDMYMNYIVYLCILASFTKSAQIPFSSWLPAAMAAPTPVSALVHSSTLVTAGVYLMIRFSPILYYFDCKLFIILSILTMFMSGLGANFEFDLKKIIALSTLSQLGLMMSILFMGFPMLSFFHLLTHAFFKSLLFLCAGLIIHSMNNSQDIRDMGYIINLYPYTSSCFIISSFSLCGLPFLSGFYSKDLILEIMSMNNINFIYYFLYMISVMFTVSYSIRLMNYLMFMGCFNYVFQTYYEDNKMMFSMILLTFFSVFLGVILMWLMFKTPYLIVLPFMLKLMPIISIFMGVIFGFMFSYFNVNMMNSVLIFNLYYMGGMWYMPVFSTLGLYKYFLPTSKMYYNMIDSGWGEYMFSYSHMLYLYNMSKMNYFIENNNVKLFMITFIFFMILIML